MGNSLAPGEIIARPELCVLEPEGLRLTCSAAHGSCRAACVLASGSQGSVRASDAISTSALAQLRLSSEYCADASRIHPAPGARSRGNALAVNPNYNAEPCAINADTLLLWLRQENPAATELDARLLIVGAVPCPGYKSPAGCQFGNVRLSTIEAC